MICDFIRLTNFKILKLKAALSREHFIFVMKCIKYSKLVLRSYVSIINLSLLISKF